MNTAFSILFLFIPLSDENLLQVTARDEPTSKTLEQAFLPEIQPLLKRYCFECHAGEEPEAEIDLTSFESMKDIRNRLDIWLQIDEMLDSRQMPPKKADLPTEAEREKMLDWTRDFLTLEALATAGDPGPVVLRRLSNSEYTYTVRDLTGIDSLNPAEEFPVDGAAGEGFTNTGEALVMSPSLIMKFFEAAKSVADHAVLLPDGIRFSRDTTRRDWTDNGLARIREFYSRFTASGGGTPVNLQGIKLQTNRDGLLPLEKYLAATLAEREALTQGTTTTHNVALERNLSPKYLDLLWQTLKADDQKEPSLLLDLLRTQWRSAAADGVSSLTQMIEQWQQVLWKLTSIGHIGREGSSKAWMVAVSPLVEQQELTLKLPEQSKDIIVYLASHDSGDGNVADFVVWHNPRLVGGDQPEVPLRDVLGLKKRLEMFRKETLTKTGQYLAAAAIAGRRPDVPVLAAQYDIDPGMLRVWLDYLNIGEGAPIKVEGHYTKKVLNTANYDFVNGWGSHETPSITANSSDQEVRIPGIARPHSIVAHPSPTRFTVAAWHSPIHGEVRVEARLVDAHPECGNGVEWFVQHRTGRQARNLWQGNFGAGGNATMPTQTVHVNKGELISFLLGPRDGNHSCDLTEINLVVTETSGANRVWDLANDVSPNILESNPHADSHGYQATWHFYSREIAEVGREKTPRNFVPEGSLIARWKKEINVEKRNQLAAQVQSLAMGQAPADQESPDAILFRHLQDLPASIDFAALLQNVEPDERFGIHPLGHEIDKADLVVRAPNVTAFRVPAAWAKGRELVVSGRLESGHGREGSVQLQLSTSPMASHVLVPTLPIIVADGSDTRRRIETAMEEFRQLFPPTLCYSRIVPVDEVVTLTLFYREDHHLQRLMLNDEQIAELNRLWDELLFISREPLQTEVAFEQITEFATQDRPDLVIEWKKVKQSIHDRANAFQQRLLETEPLHLQAVLDFANRAWRRQLTDGEQHGLSDLYEKLRKNELSHDKSCRLLLARVLASPSFLYRLEQPSPGDEASLVTPAELANRLSYFLWSSMPDQELRQAAETGDLTGDQAIVAQARRLLRDERTRRMAIQFACQWLHIRDFDQYDQKNEKLYPEFASIRGEMYEESVRFFEDMFRNDGSMVGILNADHTFLTESLAKHYGVKGVHGSEWRRVGGMRQQSRGGVLAMATVLASQSGASRSSPILRGNWVYETLLGQRLPRPPSDVPQLPDSVPSGLTARQLIEQHSSEPACAKCHERVDPYGFALEQYDAIGRLRPNPVDTKTTVLSGKTIDGIDGLRDYLLIDRHDDFIRQFCRKLLGYALGRAVKLSDKPLLADMQKQLEANQYRFSVAVEAIVTSPQFRYIRGARTAQDD